MNRSMFKGVVHGNTIQLEQEPGLPDGQRVDVILAPTDASKDRRAEGLTKSFGAWSDDGEGIDTFLEEIRRDRDQPRMET